MQSYSYRKNLLEKETVYRLDETGIRVEPTEGNGYDVAYPEILEVRLAFVPLKSARNRFECLIRAGKRKLVLCNTHFARVASFEDRSQDYIAFVEELHRRLAPYQTSIRYRRGSSLLLYLFNVGLGWLGLAIFAGMAVWTFPSNWIMGAAYLLLVLLVGGLIWRYTRVNFPSDYDPAAIPDGSLPDRPDA